MTNKSQSEDCSELEGFFLEKFDCLGHITSENPDGFGFEFVLWKKEAGLGGNPIPYYKLGSTVNRAKFMIDLWKYPPSDALTFDTRREMDMWIFAKENGLDVGDE